MSIQIAIHLITVIPAMLLGVFVLFKKKGTPVHKLLGRVWVILMLVTSVSSFFIHSEGGFSIIHLLSVITILSISISIWGIRNNKIRVHRGCMIGAYVGAMLAGLFATFVPGRIVYEFVF